MASGNNYYAFQSAKVIIAIELQKRGWQIFGFKEDESDFMTDYWSPADWDGIATKNGYIAVVDCGEYMVESRSGKEDYRYYSSNGKKVSAMTEKDRRTIEALKEMRQDRGASEQEEETAKKKIIAIEHKYKNEQEIHKIKITYPVFQKNPPHASWHVEKDGTIIAKGSGIAKYSELRFATREKVKADIKLYASDSSSWRYEDALKLDKLFKQLDTLINKIDTAAGATIGHRNETFVYETRTVVKYKHENEAVEVDPYELADGAIFVCKSYLGYDRNPGKVYKVHGDKANGFYAIQMDKALKKERSGRTVRGVQFGYFGVKDFERLIKNGCVAMCEIHDKATPYTEQKVVKKAVKTA